MGIVLNQSLKNTIITYIGFAIGGFNTIYLYPVFLGATFYGLTNYIVSSANVIMPLFAIGMQNTLVKFYSQYETNEERSRFLSFTVLFPLLLIIPMFLLGFYFFDEILFFLSKKNGIVKNYIWFIPFIGFCMAYFEIFYAWLRAHMQSVFGSFVKEVFVRILISLLLFGVYFKYITPLEFIYSLVLVYGMSLLLIVFYANKVKRIVLHFKVPKQSKAIWTYTIFIILSASIANMLLDIDKYMIKQYMDIDNIAFYSVAIFIAMVISVPSRAMHQITYPITAKLMSEQKWEELNELYKKTSITLQVIGGLILVGILVNINQLYLLLPKEYSQGLFVVFTIGLSKYFDLILGNNNAIIFNSKYYKAVLSLGIVLVLLIVLLNMYFIPHFGLNGAAFATLIAITLYSLAKLLFVVLRMKLFPFTYKTIVALGVVTVSFFAFYYWDFSFHPVLNIICKSVLVSIFYLGLCHVLKISSDINFVMRSVFNKVFKKQ